MGLNLGDESVGTYGNGTYGDNSSAHMDELISGKNKENNFGFVLHFSFVLHSSSFNCNVYYIPMFPRSGRGSGRGESGGIIIFSRIL